MRWLVRLIVLALAIAAVREMRHRQQKVVAIGEDLNDQRRGIEAAETELDASDRSIDNTESRVRELDARITAIEHEHPGGIPDSMHPEYARLVAEHNDAVALHNDLVARVEVLGDRSLFLGWGDGHETLLLLEEVRARCRCARCAGEPEYPISGR